jgi:hypothetical protein
LSVASTRTRAPYWQNQVALNIASTAGVLNSQMETVYRQCMTYGDSEPDFIVAGSKFIDAYAKDVRAQPGSTIMVTAPQKGGVRSTVRAPASSSRASKSCTTRPSTRCRRSMRRPSRGTSAATSCEQLDMKFRPVKGRWLVPRTPPRVYDRYTHYFG